MSRTWGLILRSRAALAILLFLPACGGGYSPTESRGGQKTVTVNVVDFAFDPRSVAINPGDTVRWMMRGNDLHHSVTAVNGAFESGPALTSAGATFEHTFRDANQTYDYHCKEHRDAHNMKGSVRVGDAAPPPSPGY